jgi:hypothetical protein
MDKILEYNLKKWLCSFDNYAKIDEVRRNLMGSMLLDVWGTIKHWIGVTWAQSTYIIVVCVLGVCGLLLLSSYLKGNFNKGKKIKWGPLVLALVLFGLLALVSAARFA